MDQSSAQAHPPAVQAYGNLEILDFSYRSDLIPEANQEETDVHRTSKFVHCLYAVTNGAYVDRIGDLRDLSTITTPPSGGDVATATAPRTEEYVHTGDDAEIKQQAYTPIFVAGTSRMHIKKKGHTKAKIDLNAPDVLPTDYEFDASKGSVSVQAVRDAIHGNRIDIQMVVSYKVKPDNVDFTQYQSTLSIYPNNMVRNQFLEAQIELDKTELDNVNGYTRLHRNYDVFSRRYVTICDKDAEAICSIFSLDRNDLDLFLINNVDNGGVCHLIIQHQLNPDNRSRPSFPRGISLFTTNQYGPDWTPRINALKDQLSSNQSVVHLLLTSREVEVIMQATLTNAELYDEALMAKWWTSSGVVLQAGTAQKPLDQWPAYCKTKELTYPTLRQVQTCLWVSATSELLAVQDEQFLPVSARFLEVAGSNNNAFLVYFEVNNDTVQAYRKGDALDVLIRGTHTSNPEDREWTAQVLDNSPLGFRDDICIFLRRGCTSETQYDEDGQALERLTIWSSLNPDDGSLLTAADQTDEKIDAFLRDEGNAFAIHVRINKSFKQSRRVMTGLNQWWLDDRGLVYRPRVSAKHVGRMMAANNLLTLGGGSLYDGIVNTTPGDCQGEMNEELVRHIDAAAENCNELQRECFALARGHMDGRVLNIAGGAGTGKTTVGLRLTKPFLAFTKEDKRFPGMILSPINTNVNELTAKAHSGMKEALVMYNIQRDPVVIRFHRLKSEIQAYRKEAYTVRADYKASLIQPIDQGDKATDDSNVFAEGAVELHTFVTECLRNPTLGVNNKHFKDFEHSLGFWTLSLSGWVNAKLGITKHWFADPDPSKYADFRNHMDNFVANHHFDSATNQAFTDCARLCMLDVLCKADAIVTTVNLALDPLLKECLQPFWILWDEAERVADFEFAPVVHAYSRNNPNALTNILAGDPKQLGGVLVASDPNDATKWPMYRQASLSVMERFMLTGYRTIYLTTSERHTTFVNDLLGACGRTLRQEINSANDQRPEVNIIKAALGHRHPGEWTDTSEPHVRNHAGSKANLVNVATTINNIFKRAACQSPDKRMPVHMNIIITPYLNQLSYYKLALEKISAEIIANKDDDTWRCANSVCPDVDLLVVGTEMAELPHHTADDIQGSQRANVNFDIVTSSHVGFLKDKQRIYTVLSRAQMGVTIIGCSDGITEYISRTASHSEPAILRVLDKFQELRLVKPAQPILPFIAEIIDNLPAENRHQHIAMAAAGRAAGGDADANSQVGSEFSQGPGSTNGDAHEGGINTSYADERDAVAELLQLSGAGW